MPRLRTSLATPGQIAIRVRELRRQQGLTVHQLRERIASAEVKPMRRVSASWLMKLEKGRMRDLRPYTYQLPRRDGTVETRHAGMAVVIGQIAHVLGVDPASILTA